MLDDDDSDLIPSRTVAKELKKEESKLAERKQLIEQIEKKINEIQQVAKRIHTNVSDFLRETDKYDERWFDIKSTRGSDAALNYLREYLTRARHKLDNSATNAENISDQVLATQSIIDDFKRLSKMNEE